MSDFDNELQVIIRKGHSDNPKAPPLRVDVVINGVKHTGGVWKWTRKDGTPVVDKQGGGMYIGKLEVDTWAQEQDQKGVAQARQAAQPDGGGFHNDDIPF